MKIEKVTVSYGELRSHLLNKAKSAVRGEFGDDLTDVPFF